MPIWGLDFSDNWRDYFNIDNAARVDPRPASVSTAVPNCDGFQSRLCDTIGRMFRVSIRIQN